MVDIKPGETRQLITWREGDQGIEWGPVVSVTNAGAVTMTVHEMNVNGTLYGVAIKPEMIAGSS